MLFAVDIGNTNIHVGFFPDGNAVYTFALSTEPHRTADEYAMLFRSMAELGGYGREDFDGAIIGSVVPSATAAVSAAIQRLYRLTPLTVGPGIKTGFPIRVDNPSELGADLAANTAAAIAAVGAPAFVLDFGTATTLSVVGEDRAYLGCCILPGVGMSLAALKGTELLPGVCGTGTVPLLGTNSADSIRSGVFRGQASAASGLLSQLSKEKNLPSHTPILVTGGYGKDLLPYLPEQAVYRESLTLEGLAVIYRTNRKK